MVGILHRKLSNEPKQGFYISENQSLNIYQFVYRRFTPVFIRVCMALNDFDHHHLMMNHHFMIFGHIWWNLFDHIMFKSCIWNWYLPTWGFPGGKGMPMQEMKEIQVDPWFGKIPWSRKWRPTKVFLPKKFHGQRNWRPAVHGAAKSWTQPGRRARTHTHIFLSVSSPLSSSNFLFFIVKGSVL